MICPNCGNNVEENAKFCENCGTNITNNEPINQDIQLETNQLTNENLQPMNNQPVNQNKKNNTGLIIFIIILMIVLGVLVYFFVIKKDDNKTNNTNTNQQENKTTTTVNNSTNNTTTTTVNNTINNNQSNNEVQITVDSKKEYNLTEYYQKIVNQYKTLVKNTSVETEKLGSLKVNNNKEVEIIKDNNISKVDINGEKAKYLAGIKAANAIYEVAILTEEGNIYILNVYTATTTKIESQYKFNDFVVIDYMHDTYCRSFFPFSPTKGTLIPDALIGITENNEYIPLEAYQRKLSLGKQENFLIEEIENNKEKEKQGEQNSFMVAYSSIYIFSNGELNYITGKTKFTINDNNFTEIFNQRNVKDENNNTIKARTILKDDNENIYVITLDNKIYEIINNSETIITKLHNINKVKSFNIFEKKDYDSYSYIKVNQITYEDNTTETLNVTGSLIFE